MKHSFLFLFFSIILHYSAYTQVETPINIKGTVVSDNNPVSYANVYLKDYNIGTSADSNGVFLFENIKANSIELRISAIGYKTLNSRIDLQKEDSFSFIIEMEQDKGYLDEIVVSGTLKEVNKLDSPVPVEVYNSQFFKSNPTPSIFEAVSNINGVRPQLNCSVCNTGDIRINGLEGPYTMVLIDGMPIVSGLSTVYGLFGIPQSLIERVEIVKGPASNLYGSEAVGGLINIITQSNNKAPQMSADLYITDWGELNIDLATKFNWSKTTSQLLGVNYFNYSHPIDNNNDGFTDMTLQDRFSAFSKWLFARKDNKLLSIAARYVYENRWGGDVRWEEQYRGGEDIYGESIYTHRWEVLGAYEWPHANDLMLQLSLNGHDQNSVYGNVAYLAQQYVGFAQLTWQKSLNSHSFLLGTAYRYNFYDDNTPATAIINNEGVSLNRVSHTHLPGLFIQDEIQLNQRNTLLVGARYDYNSQHGSIITPRLNFKNQSINKNTTFRLSIGNGYRVANVFTEDHAALTGARELVFEQDLKPEQSWNINLNLVRKFYAGTGFSLVMDASAFYTYFSNRIIADYDTDPNKIIYDNLDGHGVSRGLSLNVDAFFTQGLKIRWGATWQDVYIEENGIRSQQIMTERFSSVWSLSYSWNKWTVDYTGNLYGPMRLPLLRPLDPRNEFSPWWSIQNIQCSYQVNSHVELYGGIKNFLNWTPDKSTPFLIARTDDPFDKNVEFDGDGQVVATESNPYALSFDPTYVYAPNQGTRLFIGFRYKLK